MSVVVAKTPPPLGYGAQLAATIRQGIAQVVRPASHSQRATARRVLARRTLLATFAGVAIVLALMVVADVAVIGLMPVRGTASLWPLRILTDFGKSAYVLWALAVALAVVVLLAARLRGVAHATLIGVANRLEYVLLTVFLAMVTTELLKVVIGRGRPFVGGSANAFNFQPFTESEAFASFPSGHATTAGALAFAVAAVWPRLVVPMIVYAGVILATRMTLLVHHPSDVVGGASIGILWGMALRYWFAARRVAFVMRADGSVSPKHGPSARAMIASLRQAMTL